MSNVNWFRPFSNIWPGFGEEVIAALFLFIAVLLPIVLYIARNIHARFVARRRNELLSREGPARTDVCPICFDDPRFIVETNCGHSYCGSCLEQLLLVNQRTTLASLVRCPLCRNTINTLFICFTQEERSADVDSAIGQTRERILDAIAEYNIRASRSALSFVDILSNIPIILRHFVMDILDFNHGFAIFQARIFLVFISTFFYIISPVDVVPEAVYGILGLIDDILLFLTAIFYLTILYRDAILLRRG